MIGDDLADDSASAERVMGDGAALNVEGGEMEADAKEAAAAATAAAPAAWATRTSSNAADTCGAMCYA